MKLSALTAISPIDGRYRDKTESLASYFSEAALIGYRLLVEVEYFIALCEIPLEQLSGFDQLKFSELRRIYIDFTPEDALEVKEIERTTNHDVKAVEYYLKNRFKKMGLDEYKEFIHFGLTSQDINNTATPLSIKDAQDDVLSPLLNELLQLLKTYAREWKSIPMLAHTHGQPASPTLLGKEIRVFIERLENQIRMLRNIPHAAKFGGATGNLNAHYVAYPGIDWNGFANQFVKEKLGLKRYTTTTQIEHYDYFAAFCDNLKRINTILLDFSRDMWMYISMDYFKQQINKDETGSSTMPHKVNPIDFENAEGNLGMANAILEHLAAKLPVSRLQRDLSDSTVLRNIGVPFAHSLIAIKSLIRGMHKVSVNEARMKADLEDNWAVVAEAIQTILRREKYPDPYESLKELTRTGKKIDKKILHEYISTLRISKKLKEELLGITPENYTGHAE
ncbi:MAG: adenylosuccinate lyase [Bacteroidales bacterium]|nr:adenylosuccinate lyase [Lentimicrobiaceae bacterium]MDD5694506.1 adenylosuccinate lyase [Bacteroidales bacterium]